MIFINIRHGKELGMINREVIYDRNLTGSYMKIPVSIGHEFDEKMMLRRKLPGLLSVERCNIDGVGQYWYNISGKQSLDTFCRIQNIGVEFVERMIISICSEIEILERNFLDQNCLLLDPEQIFISNQNQEVIFAVYPGHHESLAVGFQQLMEYLLTKIDHEDPEAVRSGYMIYEKTLDEAYNIMDIRDEIVQRRNEADQQNDHGEKEDSGSDGIYELKMEEKSRYRKVNDQKLEKKRIEEKDDGKEVEQKVCLSDWIRQEIKKKYEEWIEKFPALDTWKKKVGKDKIGPGKGQSKQFVVYPDEPEEETPIEIHPTVCLGEYRIHPEGILMYQGTEQMPDLRMNGQVIRVGKAEDAELKISKDTISRYHARIDVQDNEYYIEDLNSTNGTYVNEEILPYKEIRKLKSNDVIRFGDVKYRFL